MAAPAAKEASVVILDVSAPNAGSFATAKAFCSTLIQQKLVLAPKDLVGVLVGGTPGALNRLNAAAPAEYKHLSVARPVMGPNADFLKAIDGAQLSPPGSANFDMLDAILVAADLIHEAVADKKYSRRIFVVSSCAGTVQRKDKLAAIIDGVKARGIALVIVGIDFEDPDVIAAAPDVDWNTLSCKQQNERVLQFACDQLGGDSLVIPVHDAMSALSSVLRKRHIAQRTYCKCVLDIGDVRIPVATYTKCLESRIPSFGKLTTKGEAVLIERRFFSVRRPDVELEPMERIKAYRYGRSAIPVNDVDEDSMKFAADRSMSALGFVPMDQLPFHVLQGATKLVTPVAGDALGAKAFSAFVVSMAAMKRAMLVRFIRCTNAAPTLAACFPSSKAEKDVLYFVALPFAEDYRHYHFSSLNDVPSATKEQRVSIESLVDALDLDRYEARQTAAAGSSLSASPAPAGAAHAAGSGGGSSSIGGSSAGDGATNRLRLLAIKETHNPALQHYYHACKERYLRPDAPLAPLPPQVARTATAWGAPGNVLEHAFTASADLRTRVRQLLPPPPPKEGADAISGAAKVKAYWFQKAGIVAVPEARDGPLSSTHHPTTTGGAVTATPTSLTPDAMVDALRVSADIHTGGHAAVVTTTDPVGTFLALVDRPGEDHVARAIHQMQEAILQLLKVSIGAQYYPRCGEALRVLRKVCAREGEPASFNTFLRHLMLTAHGEVHQQFWDDEVVKWGVLPISRAECVESDLADVDAAKAFLLTAVPAPRALLDDDPAEASLFDELE